MSHPVLQPSRLPLVIQTMIRDCPCTTAAAGSEVERPPYQTQRKLGGNVEFWWVKISCCPWCLVCRELWHCAESPPHCVQQHHGSYGTQGRSWGGDGWDSCLPIGTRSLRLCDGIQQQWTKRATDSGEKTESDETRCWICVCIFFTLYCPTRRQTLALCYDPPQIDHYFYPPFV